MSDNISKIGTQQNNVVFETSCFRLEFKEAPLGESVYSLAKHTYMPLNILDGIADKLIPHIVRMALEIQITMYGEELVADDKAPLAFASFDHTTGKMLPEFGLNLTPRQRSDCEKKFVEAYQLYQCLNQIKETKEEVFPSGRDLRFALDASNPSNYRNITDIREAITYRRETSPLLLKTKQSVAKLRAAQQNVPALPQVPTLGVIGL